MIEALSHMTYMVRHQPNCPSPFEVRICGNAWQVSENEPRNFVGYGQTVDEAAAQVIEMQAMKEAAPALARAAELFRHLWNGL